jgi:hypothetical protein
MWSIGIDEFKTSKMKSPVLPIIAVIALIVTGAYFALESKGNPNQIETKTLSANQPDKIYILQSDGSFYELRNLKNSPVTNFKKQFPNADEVEWEMENNKFEVDYKIGDRSSEMVFEPDGKIYLTKSEITYQDLPAEIIGILKKDYAEKEIDDFKKIETGGLTYYQMEIEHGKSDEELIFTEKGKLEKTQLWD